MSEALAAALLATQQRQRSRPSDRMRQYGARMMQPSNTPIIHPIQGLAEALTMGVGGYFQGQAEREDQDRNVNTRDLFGRMVAARSPEELQDIVKNAPKNVDMNMLGPALAMMVGEQQKQQAARRASGGLQDMYGGQPQQITPGAQPPMATAGMPPALPQGDAPVGGPSAFANNVGNLRASPASWAGKGQPHNGFETFATPQAGVNAAFGNLQAYARQNPNISVSQAIAKWAPPNENDTQTYIRQVSEGTGINPGMPLAEVLNDPAAAAQLLDAIARKEKGGLPPGVTADTFMTATGGQPSPIVQAQARVPQGSDMPRADASGTPLPPAPPPTATEIPKPPADPEVVRRVRAMVDRGALTEQQAVAQIEEDRNRRWQFAQQQANEDRRLQTTLDAERRRADADARKESMPSRQEMEKFRTAQAEGAAIVAALNDFQNEFPKRNWKDVTGATTPRTTAYNNAALMAKGEALFNLGVLNGPDLEIIRRTLPDPATLGGQFTSDENMRVAVQKVIDLINSRISGRAKVLGLAPSQDAAGGAPATDGPPPPPAGFRVVR